MTIDDLLQGLVYLVALGQEVIVLAVEGLILRVKPAKTEVP